MNYLSRSFFLFSIVVFLTALVPIFGCPSPGNGQGNLEARVAALETALATTQTSLAAAEAKLAHVSVEQGAINGLSGPHLIVEGCNVHVRSGSGDSVDGTVNLDDMIPISQTAPLGLGNLILGYNEESTSVSPNREGSHNLVIGPGHNFESVAGAVFGQENAAEGPLATVTGGAGNRARGYASNVSGGKLNDSSGFLSSVSGGNSNESSGVFSSILGGVSNDSSGSSSTVGGGVINNSSGFVSSVGSGNNNESSGNYSSVSGGRENEASGTFSSVSGGIANVAGGQSASVSGGNTRSAPNEDDWAAGSLLEEN